MAKAEKERYRSFYILNVKLRKRTSTKDLSPEDYIRVFKRLHKRKIHAESSSSKHCIFRFMFEEKNNKGKLLYLSGTFARFTFIQNEKWFNLKSLDIDEQFKVPDGLFPDAVIIDYVFIPDAHRFCYRVGSDVNVSPYSIKMFLEKALDQVTDKNEYAQVDVETDRASIDMILAAKEIKKLYIDINYSNVDFGPAVKKFVEDDIKASNTSRLQISATQKPDVSIDVSQSQILAGALEGAISNGEAEATVIDENNRTQKIKTSNFPRKETVYGTFARFNERVYEKIIQIFRRNGN